MRIKFFFFCKQKQYHVGCFDYNLSLRTYYYDYCCSLMQMYEQVRSYCYFAIFFSATDLRKHDEKQIHKYLSFYRLVCLLYTNYKVKTLSFYIPLLFRKVNIYNINL